MAVAFRHNERRLYTMSNLKSLFKKNLELLHNQEIYNETIERLKKNTDVPITELIDLLNTEDQIIQAGLVEIIVSKGLQAIQPVLNAMQTDSQVIQGNCISILTRIGKKSIKPLLNKIENTPMGECGVYVQAAGQFGDHILEELRKKIFEEGSTSELLFALLINYEPSIISENEDKIISLLSSPDQNLVSIVSDHFVNNGSNGIPILIKMIGSLDPFAQQNATNALIRIGKPSVPMLIDALGNISQITQQNAVRALKEIGEISAEELIEAMNGATGLRQQNISIVLGSFAKKKNLWRKLFKR